MRRRQLLLLMVSAWILVLSRKPDDRAIAAFQNPYCKESSVKIKDSSVEKYWKYSGSKVAPNFVLDYYQDPNLTGVDITVTIETTELVATYWKMQDVCRLSADFQPEGTKCAYTGKPQPGFRYAYLTRECVQQPPETTYRSIDVDSVSVWLDMTDDTRTLLGPGPYYEGSKPVLRYLYPDQWALRVVRPGEKTIIERPSFKNPEDVIEFLKKNKDYVILESDAKAYIVETRMKTMYSRATSWPAIALVESGHCVAGVNKTGMDSALTEKAGGERICDFDPDEYNGAINRFTITMKKIPLDLPGEWYIGVGFSLRYAAFDGGNGHEPEYGSYNYVNADESKEAEFTFESYILRSAPCNPNEIGGCWDKER
jgi:hypothetical protein